MKLAFASIIAYLSVASAHSIFQVYFVTNTPSRSQKTTDINQEISVTGEEYGDLVGIRAPDQNNPTEDVTSPDMTCGKVALTDDTIIPVSAGDRVGAWWGHVLGGPMSPDDADHPIASSHHGPITAWLAPVEDAASAEADSSLGFFKVAEDGFDMETNTWGVDNMIANDGWAYFDVPECIAPGDYILRVELLALHSAYEPMGAQFYISCANIRISGDGDFEPDETQNFPGAYEQDDPAIHADIWGATPDVADNEGEEYFAPGMRPITC